PEHAEPRGMRYGLLQYLHRLGGEFALHDRQSRNVAARPRQACDMSEPIGIVFVACRARSVSVEDSAKITSTFMRTNSAAASCSCSTVSAQRNSMTRFLPST